MAQLQAENGGVEASHDMHLASPSRHETRNLKSCRFKGDDHEAIPGALYTRARMLDLDGDGMCFVHVLVRFRSMDLLWHCWIANRKPPRGH